MKSSEEDDEVFPSGIGVRRGIASQGYTLEEFQAIATGLRGADFARWIVARKEPLETLFLVCHEAGVVLLPRREPAPSFTTDRVSAANQCEGNDGPINRVIQLLFSRYRSEFT